MIEWSVKHTGISLMDYIVSSLTSEIAPPFSSRRTRRFTGQIVSYGSSTEKSIYAIARGRTFTRIYSIGIRRRSAFILQTASGYKLPSEISRGAISRAMNCSLATSSMGVVDRCL